MSASAGSIPLRPGGTAIGTDVVARPVNRSGWKDWVSNTAGGGADPADAVDEPRWAASALGRGASWMVNRATDVSAAVMRVLSEERVLVIMSGVPNRWPHDKHLEFLRG